MLSTLVDDLLAHPPDAGPSGVLLRVAGLTADHVEHCAGHRMTYRTRDGRPQPLTTPATLTPDALFDLASVTKVAVTTAALLSLTDTGILDPDDAARDWLPGLPAEVRLSHLLRHRAGLAAWWPVYTAVGDGTVGGHDAASAEAVLADLPVRYPIDTARHYSDLGFMLLGRVVERAADRPLAEAAARLVFAPAGMPTAHYRPAGAGRGGPVVATAHGDWYERDMLATGRPHPTGVAPERFTRWRDHTLLGEVHDGNAWHAFGGVAGHAGLFGTAEDLVAFGRALLRSLADDQQGTHSPGPGPWRPDTVRRFFAAGPDPGQGLGFWRWPAYGAIGHAGFTGIRFAVLPAVRRVVVLLTNRVHTVRHELLDLGPVWERILATVAEGEW